MTVRDQAYWNENCDGDPTACLGCYRWGGDGICAEPDDLSIESDRERIWCFEHQERCEGPETECKFLKDGDFCKLFDKTIIKHKKRL